MSEKNKKILRIIVGLIIFLIFFLAGKLAIQITQNETAVNTVNTNQTRELTEITQDSTTSQQGGDTSSNQNSGKTALPSNEIYSFVSEENNEKYQTNTKTKISTEINPNNEVRFIYSKIDITTGSNDQTALIQKFTFDTQLADNKFEAETKGTYESRVNNVIANNLADKVTYKAYGTKTNGKIEVRVEIYVVQYNGENKLSKTENFTLEKE